MTDAELLEKAARAAGTECQWFGAELRIQRPDKLWELWSPLTDDGDALRLAVKLRLTIDVERDRCCISVGDHSGRFGVQPWGTEGAEAATRRAIVRAAAGLVSHRPEPEPIRCPERLKNGGHCPHHNLHCGWPACNKEAP